jgi:hypothetical protein
MGSQQEQRVKEMPPVGLGWFAAEGMGDGCEGGGYRCAATGAVAGSAP